MSYSDDLDWLASNLQNWEPGFDLCVVEIGKDGERYYRFPSICSSGITKREWLVRRAELQNKPSWDKAPVWAIELAQDSDGRWYFYADTPTAGHTAWRIEGTGYNELGGCGVALGDWRDTLERRPEMYKATPQIDTSSDRVRETGKSIPIGHKADHGKPIMGAIPPHAELAVARVLTFGAEKYARDGWQAVENAEVRYMDAALRHLNAHRRGELVDDESGESHLAHAACCILFMLDMQERKEG